MENTETQAVIADGAAAIVPEVITPAASQEPTVEELKSLLDASEALREIAESDAINAKKDIVAIKTGKKRSEIDATQIAPPTVAPKTDAPKPAETQPDLAAELAEVKRQNAEILRGLAGRGGVLPTGGGGQAESPSPKPKGYWSEAKLAELKKRGYSDEKIERMAQLVQKGPLAALGERTSADSGIAKRQY